MLHTKPNKLLNFPSNKKLLDVSLNTFEFCGWEFEIVIGLVDSASTHTEFSICGFGRNLDESEKHKKNTFLEETSSGRNLHFKLCENQVATTKMTAMTVGSFHGFGQTSDFSMVFAG